MDEHSLREILTGLPLGGLRYFDRTGSTNEQALVWASQGAPDLGLVCADEQTAGRGRGGRTWVTRKGAGLAVSLVLRLSREELHHLPRLTALGALSVAEVLETLDLPSEIKWPNDVLVHQRKVCGVLVEAAWQGETLQDLVLGMGVNVCPDAVPPPEEFNFPATCLEAETGTRIDRLRLLREILLKLLYWRPRLATDAFWKAWEDRLAFRNQQVVVQTEGGSAWTGRLEGLEQDGSLRLRSSEGALCLVQFGEVHLRPVV